MDAVYGSRTSLYRNKSHFGARTLGRGSGGHSSGGGRSAGGRSAGGGRARASSGESSASRGHRRSGGFGPGRDGFVAFGPAVYDAGVYDASVYDTSVYDTSVYAYCPPDAYIDDYGNCVYPPNGLGCGQMSGQMGWGTCAYNHGYYPGTRQLGTQLGAGAPAPAFIGVTTINQPSAAQVNLAMQYCPELYGDCTVPPGWQPGMLNRIQSMKSDMQKVAPIGSSLSLGPQNPLQAATQAQLPQATVTVQPGIQPAAPAAAAAPTASSAFSLPLMALGAAVVFLTGQHK